jgi:hypothetical protein
MLPRTWKTDHKASSGCRDDPKPTAGLVKKAVCASDRIRAGQGERRMAEIALEHSTARGPLPLNLESFGYATAFKKGEITRYTGPAIRNPIRAGVLLRIPEGSIEGKTVARMGRHEFDRVEQTYVRVAPHQRSQFGLEPIHHGFKPTALYLFNFLFLSPAGCKSSLACCLATAFSKASATVGFSGHVASDLIASTTRSRCQSMWKR